MNKQQRLALDRALLHYDWLTATVFFDSRGWKARVEVNSICVPGEVGATLWHTWNGRHWTLDPSQALT